MGAIKPDMKIKLRMEGNVNGHHFVIDGDGTGKPFEGKQSMDLEVKEGGPLPFAFDILTTAFHYGNRVFAKYPDNIQDYFKQSFPKGYSWERSLTFEDGGICIARNDITMEGDTFYNKVRFYGTNFPANGPVMQKKTLKWEPSTEKMYVRDGVLTGDIHMALLLEGNAHYRCDFRTTYKAKEKGVKLPGYHFVDHCIEILSHDKDYNKVKLYEHAVAHSGLPDNARRGSRGTTTTRRPATTTGSSPGPTQSTAASGARCTASYQVNSDWGNGFTVTVAVTNSGSVATKTWTVSWTFGGNQTITNSWNAAVTQNGQSVTARNMSYNNVIQPGQNTTFGFQASYTGSNAAPTVACAASDDDDKTHHHHHH
nr:mEos2-CBM2 fusion [synthetic construct]